MEQASEYIQKHFAWIIAAIVAFTCITITLVINKRRTQKAFSYRVLLDESLVSVRDRKESSKITVSYDGRPVTNVRLVHIELRNTGALPIEASDFQCPAKMEFTEGTELLDPKVIRSFPHNLVADIVHEGHIISLMPTLINPKERLVIKVLIAQQADTEMRVSIYGRFKGFSGMTEYRPTSERFPLQSLYMILMPGVAMSLLMSNPIRHFAVIAFAVVALLLALAMLYYTVKKIPPE